MLPAPIADSALVTPSPGLMIWTLVIFFITMYLLKRLAFGRIAQYIDERRTAVRENLESAERSRTEAQALFEDYKAKLAEARSEASQIVERSRKTSEELSRQMREEANQQRERDLTAARAAIQAETRQSLDQIKNEVAELTVLATEKVVGRSLDEAEQRRLVEEALADVDFTKLVGEEA